MNFTCFLCVHVTCRGILPLMDKFLPRYCWAWNALGSDECKRSSWVSQKSLLCLGWQCNFFFRHYHLLAGLLVHFGEGPVWIPTVLESYVYVLNVSCSSLLLHIIVTVALVNSPNLHIYICSNMKVIRSSFKLVYSVSLECDNTKTVFCRTALNLNIQVVVCQELKEWWPFVIIRILSLQGRRDCSCNSHVYIYSQKLWDMCFWVNLMENVKGSRYSDVMKAFKSRSMQRLLMLVFNLSLLK